MRPEVVMVMVVWGGGGVAGVLSPLDKVTQDMRGMKETLDSIQASLITSVSMLQGEECEHTPRCDGLMTN